MQNTGVLEETRVGKDSFKDFDLAMFTKKTFGMYGGEDNTVTLLCHNSLAGVTVDRFGQDVAMVPVDDEHFYVKVFVSVSRQFFGWLTGIGEMAKITSPESVKNEYREYLNEIIKNY